MWRITLKGYSFFTLVKVNHWLKVPSSFTLFLIVMGLLSASDVILKAFVPNNLSPHESAKGKHLVMLCFLIYFYIFGLGIFGYLFASIRDFKVWYPFLISIPASCRLYTFVFVSMSSYPFSDDFSLYSGHGTFCIHCTTCFKVL